MNTEHTPGPWRVGNGSFVISDHPAPGITGSDDVQHYGGHLICESVSQANARLIAAAPELLAALKDTLVELKEFQRIFGICVSHGERMDGWLEEVEEMIAKIEPAIAKAEGKA